MRSLFLNRHFNAKMEQDWVQGVVKLLQHFETLFFCRIFRYFLHSKIIFLG